VAKPVVLCTVPSLTGKTAAGARKALRKAGCAVGRVSGSKSTKARVRSQSIPRRVRVLAGTKVGITLAVPKKHR
jgi:beta-lactam-binding protein with PASTA domain